MTLLRSFWKWVPFFLLFLMINLFVISFIGQERYIYFWDYSGYWMKFQDLSHLFRETPSLAISTLINSIRHDEYNFFTVLFLIPFNFFLGDGRLSFILSIVNLYALPTLFLLFFLLKKIIIHADPVPPPFPSFPLFLTVSLIPQFWIPILIGLPDVFGVFIITLILLISIKEPIEKQKRSNLLVIGCLLSCIIMVRRWYAFWVVSFLFALFFESLIFNLKEYHFKLKPFLTSAKNVSFIGIISVILFVSIATPIAKKMLSTDYADIYSAYRQEDSIIGTLKLCFDYFGPLPIFFFLLGFAQSIFSKKTARLSFFLLIQMIIILLLFSRVQNFDLQHYYLLLPAMIIFISLFVIKTVHSLKSKYSATLFLIGFSLFLFINYLMVLVPKSNDYLQKVEPLFPKVRHYPLVRGDIEEIHNLIQLLKNMIKTEKDALYVLSSSVILNDDLLRNACILNHLKICDRILPVNHVDKRDGFPQQFLSARYVIVTDPLQYHLNPDDQRVIGILADQIIHQKNIGAAYEKLHYEFTLDHHVKVSIYEKKGAFKKGDLDDLSQLFSAYYRDQKDIFKIHYPIEEERRL